jgi:cytochrome c
MLPTRLEAQEFRTLKGHGGPIMGIAVSDTGQVATASFDNSIGLWSTDGPTWLEGHDAAVTALSRAPDGRWLSGSDDFSVLVWTEGEPHELGRHKGKVTSVAASSDGRWIGSGSWDGTVMLWGQGDAPVVLSAQKGGVNDIAFSADTQTLFVATSSGEVMAYDLAHGFAARPLVKHGFGVNRLAVDAEGEWLAYGAVDGVTRIIDPEDGQALADISLDRRPILALARHSGRNRLAVGDGHGYIMVVDTESWRITRDFRAMRNGPVWALAFSPDGETIWAGGLQDVVYGWPVALLDEFEARDGGTREFLRDPDTMPNGERQFARKCSICHSLTSSASRKAGPTLFGVFGRRAGAVTGYRYSPTLEGSDIIWTEDTIDALFDEGPDHFIPGSKMPMQRITQPEDRRDLIAFLKQATQ